MASGAACAAALRGPGDAAALPLHLATLPRLDSQAPLLRSLPAAWR